MRLFKVSLFYFIVPLCAFSQVPLDSMDLSVSGPEKLYNLTQTLSGDSHDGQYEILIRKSRNTHPFFHTGNWSPITIKFKEKTFGHHSALYDLEKNRLYLGVIRDDMVYAQEPRQDAIEWFYLQGSLFKRLTPGMLIMPDGFYEEFVEGKNVSMYIKRKKITEISDGEAIFISNDSFYLFIKDRYYIYTGKRSFLSHFPEQRREIMRYVRNNNLSFSRYRENNIKMILQFCNTL